jgi:hypothetical protein
LIDVSDSILVLVRHREYLYTAFRVTYTFSLSLSLAYPPSLTLGGKLRKFSHKFKLLFLMFHFARKVKSFYLLPSTLPFNFFIIWTASSNLCFSISSARENLIFWNSTESVCHQFCYQLYCHSITHHLYTTEPSLMTFFSILFHSS